MSRFSRWHDAKNRTQQQQAKAETTRVRAALLLMDLKDTIFEENLPYRSRLVFEYLVYFRS